MTVKFTLDTKRIPNGSVLVFGIRYDREPEGDTRGRTNPKVYTYAMLKAGGLWYVTGSGQVPTAAGWGAIERWLGKDGRVVEWVDVMGEPTRLWTAPAVQEPATPTVRRRGTEWRDKVRTAEDDALGYHDL